MYAYVPKVTATNAIAKMITVADENSFIVGVGAVGSVTVLLVGMNIACMAVDWVTVYVSVVSVEVVPPTFPTITQHRNLKPVSAVAVKVCVEPAL